MTQIKKRVAIFVYSLGGGGAEKAAMGLYEGLKGDYELFFVTVSPVTAYDVGGLNVTVLGENDHKSSKIKKLFGSLKLFFSFVSFCRKNKISTVISFLSRPNIIAVAVKLFCKNLNVIATEHSTISKYYDDSLTSKVFLFFLRAAYLFADKVVAVSQGIQADLVENIGIGKEKIEVIHNPIDIDTITEMSKEKLENRGDGFVFVTAGRLTESKNYPFLFEAFKTLPSFCRLWILGDGELKSELRFLAVESGIHERVKFFGFCQNPYKYFAAADCFVSASKLEGLPTVLLEAMACGLPIVATDCHSGPREILGGDDEMLFSGIEKAKHGILVSLDTPIYLSLGMQKIIDEDSTREGYKESTRDGLKDFLPEFSIAKYQKLINSERR